MDSSSADRPATVLVVDDTPQNIKVLEAMLDHHGYTVVSATSGQDALATIARQRPDVVLLDVVMPGLDGYSVCSLLREDSATRFLPVIMITASGERPKVQALEIGADDFLQKPFDQAELLARVRTLLRVKQYHDTIERQALEVAELNRTLEARVQQQVEELERLGRLRRFLSPRLAQILVSAEGESLLGSHRRHIAVVCCRLRGFTALSESLAPEELLAMLGDYYAALGEIVDRFEATVSAFDEDRLKVVLNDPLPCDDPAGQAVRLAVAMRDRMDALVMRWAKRGHELQFGVGLDIGYATLGRIGSEARTAYGAIGLVGRVAWALAEQTRGGQVLTTQRVYATVEDEVEVTRIGEMTHEGFTRPVVAYSIECIRSTELVPIPSERERALLTDREWEVVELIRRGQTNRDIGEALVIAEGTAVRHVSNIMSKLGLRSRAQVAVWAIEHGQATRSQPPVR